MVTGDEYRKEASLCVSFVTGYMCLEADDEDDNDDVTYSLACFLCYKYT